VLRRGAENLTTTAWGRLLAGIEAGDERGQIAAAWVAAQELRAIYRCRDRNQAAQRLHDWTVMCIDPGVPEIGRLARTVTTWPDEFLAHFSTGSGQPVDQEKFSESDTDSETSTTAAYASCCTVG
jgi:Transposase